MYSYSSFVICGVLLVAMIAALEAGYQIGRRRERRSNDGEKSQLNAVQGSLLGLLALILGFTFSLSLQRFDERSRAVVDEANAIGTTLLRAELLHTEIRDTVRRTLRDYVELRVRMGKVAVTEEEQRGDMLRDTVKLQNLLWQQASKAVELDDRAATTGLYVQALNGMIDSYGLRSAALDRHVPEMALFLLFLTFLMVSLIVGTTSGVAGTRPPAAMLIMVVLIVILSFLIIDLDRPRRGLIEIDQSSMSDLLPSVAPSTAYRLERLQQRPEEIPA